MPTLESLGRLALFLLTVGFVMNSGATFQGAAATQALTLTPADSASNWSLVARKGICARPVCALMTDLTMHQTTPRPNVCGLLNKPEARTRGIQLPLWQRQNYRDHLDEIKEAILQDNTMFRIGAVGKQIGPREYEELKAQFWSRFGTAIMALFETGGASYETTQFDFDDDDVPNSLYRISQVDPVTLEPARNPRVPTPNSAWRQATCDEEGTVPLYHVFLAADEELRLPHNYLNYVSAWLKQSGSSTEVFRFDGRSFLLKAQQRSTSLAETDRARGDNFLAREIWEASFYGRNGPGYPTRVQSWSGSR